ncbi:MAG: tetratricopeptide repeat protein [Spirochaetaceae bacterium]|nr:tetratricopeptide repeat protein [Spirochaetaceae bacterium]
MFLAVSPVFNRGLWAQPRNVSYSTAAARIDNGIGLYEQGRWAEAVQELRRAWREADNNADKAEALFWTAIAELSNGEYENALYDLDDIRRYDPSNIRLLEVPYHKGRALFYLKRYDDAIRHFEEYERSIRVDGRYMNSIRYENFDNSSAFDSMYVEYNKKASAIYWIGECYFSIENYDKALGYYTLIVDQYMKSHKYESSMNRIELIKQKKAMADLRVELQVLQTGRTPVESPGGGMGAPVVETLKGGPSYDEAILAYQSRIAPYLVLNALNEDKKKQGGEPAAAVKNAPAAAVPVPGKSGGFSETQPAGTLYVQQTGRNTDQEVTKRLLAIKSGALSMMEKLLMVLNTYEMIETQRW